MASTLIKGARGVHGANIDILIEDGVIKRIAESIDTADAEVLSADGLYAAPGFIDLHCHLREPGYEYKETIATGAKAAAKGGFTQVCTMANTIPANDCTAVTEFVLEKSRAANGAKVNPIGALSMGLKGKELTEMAAQMKAGCVAFSDDGKGIESAHFMRIALRYAKAFGAVIALHEEDKQLSANGLMHEGAHSVLLGLRGIPASSESSMIARDLVLAKELDARVHICHVSCRESVELIRYYKAQGVRVTAETCPHYFAADDSMVDGISSMTKVSPPLRSADDVQAVIEGLKDGTIDAIATDHAPHHTDDKMVEYELAQKGIVGFETAFALSYTYLVEPGHLTLPQMIGKLTIEPARAFGLAGGELLEGGAADITLFDNSEWVVEPEKFISKGKNTPFGGLALRGRVRLTMVGGKIVWRDEQ